MTELYLIRHGEAEGNVFRRIHGQYDTLLTPRGMRQVSCVEKRFADIPIDACFSSDLTRTSLTARAVYVPKGLKLQRDKRFREVNLGVWEDLPFGYLDTYEPEEMWHFNHDTVNWHTPGAETFDEFTQRFVEGMRDAAQAYDGGAVAVFSHGAVIRGTLMRLFFRGEEGNRPFCDNTGVCKLIYDRGSFSYEYLNDNSHLPRELSTFALQYWWRSTGNRKDVNLMYLPYSPTMAIPKDVTVPELDSNGFALAAVLRGEIVGMVSMAAPKGDLGEILGMSLLDRMDGRLYGDQLLGAAFSHFRHLGCKRLAAMPGWYPDDILRRYEFDPQTLCRNIDPNVFDWGDGK